MAQRRLASRILLVSPSHRLLLLKVHYKVGALAGRNYWATPGGHLKDGESFEAAAMRELYEETGVCVQSVGACVFRREFPWKMPNGENVLAIENFYVVRTSDEYCSSARWSTQERDVVCEMKWWLESELKVCNEEVLPPGLSVLFGQVLRTMSDGDGDT